VEDRREAGAKRRRMEQQNREYQKSLEVAYVPGAPPPPPPPSVTVQGATANAKKGKQPVQPNPMMPLFKPGDRSAETKALNHDMIVNRGAIRQANLANKSAALALKETMLKKPIDEGSTSVPAKRKADEIEESSTPNPLTPSGESDNEPNLDTVQLWSPGYRDRYYQQKFNAPPEDLEIRKA
jgi:5'-3' exoribonuclease 2